MDIVRNDDGSLIVPVQAERHHDSDDDAASDTEATPVVAEETTRVLHPGEGGYDEALAAWDLQQHPDREAAVSTRSGREEAMTVVHAVRDVERPHGRPCARSPRRSRGEW